MTQKTRTAFNRLTLGTVAAAMTFGLAGCGHNEPPPIKQEVLQTMHDKAVGSYTLIPIMTPANKDAGTPAGYSGNFTGVIKENEITNTQAVNDAGKPGTMKCSTYSATPLRLNALGELTARYSSWGGRYCSTQHDVVIKPASNQLKIPADSGFEGCYGGRETLESYGTLSYCSFTPNM